ncbi:MAG: chemoreceptor glutamine deamidase CheD [Gammaproteobacteria bacterium]|nr:chemoreceptor glutamine deamidase CheD [Gammaproteobacteria bacterium]
MNLEFKPAFPEFSHIKRYVDKQRNIIVAKILPGEFYVTKQDEAISTVLGSCISACIWDEKMGIGGMNHFMLPIKGDSFGVEDWQHDNSYTCRYGLWAMEYLINEILKYGGYRQNLKVKLFGGGKVLANMTSDVGDKNIVFAQEYIENEGLEIVSSDVGGTWPRKVLFYPTTGRALVKKLHTTHNDTIQRRESQYLDKLEQPSAEVSQDIELF